MHSHTPKISSQTTPPPEHKSASLPRDIATLQAMLVERDLLIEKLKLQIARMKRARFGQSSEQHDSHILQLELIVEDLESTVGTLNPLSNETPAINAEASPIVVDTEAPPASPPPTRTRQLPLHLQREQVRYEPSHVTTAASMALTVCGCKHCGANADQLTHLGDDESELLEYVPSRFKVIVQVRPKYVCGGCHTISQADAPTRPLNRSYAGPGLLAHVLTSKYADHLPLYRQSEIYAREGVELSRSTLADWVGGVSLLLTPLVNALQRHVISADKLHADDTPVPVLQPGRGSTKLGRLWTYVRDDRAAGGGVTGNDSAAVWFAYSPDRKGAHPQQHLDAFKGILQADGYAGFDRLYQARDGSGKPLIVEAACWAHARRKFFDLNALNAQGAQVAQGGSETSVAAEVLRRIGELYAVEQAIRGKPPDERSRIRQLHSRPKIDELKRLFDTTLAKVSRKSDLASAIGYALTRWTALTRFVDDGRIEIDNNAAERALRCVALGRKNFLFAGSDAGGKRAAAIYSLIGTAKLNGIDPEAYLRYVISHIGNHPINKVDELLPWRIADKLMTPNTAENSNIALAA
jgi:transposase